MADHINKWENIKLIAGYYVIGGPTIPYPKFEVLIDIISKVDIVYHIKIGDMWFCTCPNFKKNSSQL
jgi:hypothetical protein